MTVVSKGPHLSEPEPQSPASGCESIGIKALLSSRAHRREAEARSQERGLEKCNQVPWAGRCCGEQVHSHVPYFPYKRMTTGFAS